MVALLARRATRLGAPRATRSHHTDERVGYGERPSVRPPPLGRGWTERYVSAVLHRAVEADRRVQHLVADRMGRQRGLVELDAQPRPLRDHQIPALQLQRVLEQVALRRLGLAGVLL